jgi:alkanesulfonate monooxygenase SsuD/methylene tetrahydromethanopterin reductase-like flavin-dependent oxidoreductase (luciferase family)
MRSGLFFAPFEELADPITVASLGAEAEEAGWHGLFVWDHIRWREPIRQVADPWITLAAVASATETIRLGTLVTPLARRRPAKVARETATLDRLSGGRLTLGVGLGGDQFAGEFSKTGEQLDDRVRGEMLDEALEILTAAWSGEPVKHRGKHYLVDDVQFHPVPVQRPRVRVWVAAMTETASRCAGRPATTGFFLPASKAWMSSRKPWRRFATCAGIARHLMRSRWSYLPAATSRPTSRPARRGG